MSCSGRTGFPYAGLSALLSDEPLWPLPQAFKLLSVNITLHSAASDSRAQMVSSPRSSLLRPDGKYHSTLTSLFNLSTSSTSADYNGEAGDELILAERSHSLSAFIVSDLAPQGRM